MTPASYILSCESTADYPYAEMTARNIPVLFYHCTVDNRDFEDDMQRTPGALHEFYDGLEKGRRPVTSQLNIFQYTEFLEALLQKGDVLHICFGTGMTQSYRNAAEAAAQLTAKYPNRRLIVLDSLCSSSGYGLLVDYAADLRDAGKGIQETADWVTAHRQQIHHQFFSTRLDFYRRSGRISGPSAMLGTVLGLCPLMRLDATGHIVAYGKARGINNAIRATAEEMKKHALGGTDYSGKCVICHAHCPDIAARTAEALRSAFRYLGESIRIYEIGSIIAAHCGPGTVAVFFLGDQRV